MKSVQCVGYSVYHDIQKLSPSLRSPLVISVCESPEGEDSDDGLRPTDEDTDETFVNRILGSWARQRSQMTAMFKTLLYFSSAPIWRIIVLTDTLITFEKVVNITGAFPRRQRERLRFERREQWYPQGYPEITTNWRPCAWAKQFLTEALPQEDAVVFIDTDLIFLGPAEEMWQVFDSMTPSQVVALAPEPQYLDESPPRDYAGSTGINTGVMIANLTRIRQLPGGGLGIAIINEGPILPAPRHDQDALNHFLKPKPHLLLELTSRWNFLPSSCKPQAPSCPDCMSSGILALHGADMTFFRYIDVKFKMMYANLIEIKFDEAPAALLARIQSQLTLLDTGRRIFPCSSQLRVEKND
ncbi:glucoside xylosyltransferase 1-like [Penaeus japonicus]|uniref:glucoside xylosyltransferase 1-like n=1 Tax=Penaeus japonicus TaxID=27405 RepID=UPI001C70B8FD|nr:glucoside xylosyltransferase 1-like [Penaeus japonicus]